MDFAYLVSTDNFNGVYLMQLRYGMVRYGKYIYIHFNILPMIAELKKIKKLD